MAIASAVCIIICCLQLAVTSWLDENLWHISSLDYTTITRFAGGEQ
jgi:hypothetical protein